MRISDWSSDVCSSDLEFELSTVGDGTGAGGRQMIGLGGAIPIIPNTGTYGSIDRASVANWRTSTFDIPEGDVAGYTTWDSTTARPIIEQISLMRSRNGRYADLLIADANSYQPISASFVDRKSTRLIQSLIRISYAVSCLK